MKLVETETPDDQSLPSQRQAAPLRAVVFDEDPDFSRLLTGWLAEHGVEAEVLSPDDEPIRQVRELRPEIVFIAVELPDKDGYGLLSRIKKAIGNRAPIVMMTATLPQSDLDLHAKQKLHADVYLRKTLSAQDLLPAIGRLIGLSPDSAGPEAVDSAEEDGAPEDGPDKIAANDAPPAVVEDGASSVRRILFFDDDPDFPHLAAGWLEAYGIDIDVASPDDEPVRKTRELNPELLFIAVELPDKRGYSLFSRMKKALGNRTPIVLATATLPQDDLDLHAKQSLHASAYLRKSFSPDELLAALDRLIGLKTPKKKGGTLPSAPEGPAVAVKTVSDVGRDANAAVLAARETAAETSGKASRAPRLDKIEGEMDPSWLLELAERAAGELSHDLVQEQIERLKALHQENRRLRLDLDDERRSSRSTPFSDEFLELRRGSREKDRELAALRGQHEIREQELDGARRELRTLDRERRDSMQEVEARLAEARSEIEELRSNADARAEKIYEGHRKALDQLRDELQEEKRAAVQQVEEARETELTKLYGDQKRTLQELGQAHSAEMALAEEKSATRVAKLEERVEEERRAADERLARERDSHQHTRDLMKAKLAEYKSHHQALELLVEQERSSANQAMQTVAQLEASLQERQRTERLENTRALEALRSEHEQELETLGAEREEEGAALEATHREALKAARIEAREELRGRLEEARAALQEAEGRLEAMREETATAEKAQEQAHQDEMQRAHREYDEALAEAAATHEQVRRELEEEHRRLEVHTAELTARLDAAEEKRLETEDRLEKLREEMDASQEAWQDRLEEEKRQSRVKLETLRAEHAEDFDSREAEYQELLDKERAEHKQARRRLEEKLTRLEVRSAELQTKLEANEEKRREAEQLVGKLREEIRTLGEDKKASETAWRKRLDDTEIQHAAELRELRERNSAEKDEIRQKLAEKHTRLEIQAAELQTKLETEEGKVREAQAVLRKVRGERKKAARSFDVRLERVEKAHQKNIDALNGRLAEERGRASVRLEELEAKLETEETDHLQTREMLRELGEEKYEAIRTLEARLEKAERERGEESAALSDLREEKAAFAEHLETVHEEYRAKLKARAADNREALDKERRAHQEALDEADRTRKEELRALAEKQQRLESQSETAEAELKASCDAAQVSLHEIRAERDGLVQRLGETERAHESDRDALRKLHQERDTLAKKLEEAQQEHGTERGALDELREEKEALVKELAGAREDHEADRVALNTVRREKDVLAKELKEAGQERGADQATLDELRQQKDALAKKLEDVERRQSEELVTLRERHEAELAAAGGQVKAAREEIESLRKSLGETENEKRRALEEERALRMSVESRQQTALDEALLSALADKDDSATAEREELQRRQAREIEALRQEHAQATEALQNAHAERIETLGKAEGENLAAVAQEARRVQEETEKRFEQLLAHEREAVRREVETDYHKALTDLEDRMRKEKAEAVASTFEERKESEAAWREKVESLEREREVWRTEREAWRAELESERESVDSRLAEEVERARRSDRQEYDALATQQGARVVELEADAKKQQAHVGKLEAGIQHLQTRIAGLEATAEKRDARIQELESAVQERQARIRGLESDTQQRHARVQELEATVGKLRREHAEALAARAFDSREKSKQERNQLARDEKERALREELNQARENLETLRRKQVATVTQLRDERQATEQTRHDDRQKLVEANRLALAEQAQKYQVALAELEKKHQAALEQLEHEPTPPQESAAGSPQEVLKAEWTAHQQTRKELESKVAQLAAMQEHVEMERTSVLEAMQTVASVEAESAAKIHKVESRYADHLATLRQEYQARARVLVEFWDEIEGRPESEDTARFLRLLEELLEELPAGPDTAG